jgi:HD-GYP domain-containing protein (c-di-GMP phosphodiesterase class II)
MKNISPNHKDSKSALTIEEIDSIIKRLAEEGNGKSLSYLDDAELLSIQDTMRDVSKKIDAATKIIKEIFNYVRETEKVPLSEVQNDILPVIQEAVGIPHIYFLFKQMQSKDEYTYRHNISVGIISAFIGKWLNLPKDELNDLTLAATLHDIGKTKISEEILHKPGRLTYTEYEEMKRHTIYGYELLKQVPDLPISIPLTALQHHERENGEGYPLSLKGDNLHLFSKITAVADVFHAMSSDRVYHEAIPFYKVISQMNDDVFGRFDPKVMLVFLNQMMETLVGKTVLLTDKKYGKIVMINRYDPVNSLVKTDAGIINLSLEKEIHIEKVISD